MHDLWLLQFVVTSNIDEICIHAWQILQLIFLFLHLTKILIFSQFLKDSSLQTFFRQQPFLFSSLCYLIFANLIFLKLSEEYRHSFRYISFCYFKCIKSFILSEFYSLWVALQKSVWSYIHVF